MLEVKDATITIGEKMLAERLSFIAHDGEITCISGHEGAGKTTLLRTLMGFLPVKEGFVSVDGELLTVRSAHAFRTLMVYLPQQMQALRHQLMPPEAPVCEAGETFVWHPVVPPKENGIGETVPTPLSADEIYQLASETLRQAANKPIVIADEPTAQLTPELTGRMLELLRQQAAEGKTVLITSRKPEVIACANQEIDLGKVNR